MLTSPFHHIVARVCDRMHIPPRGPMQFVLVVLVAVVVVVVVIAFTKGSRMRGSAVAHVG